MASNAKKSGKNKNLMNNNNKIESKHKSQKTKSKIFQKKSKGSINRKNQNVQNKQKDLHNDLSIESKDGVIVKNSIMQPTVH